MALELVLFCIVIYLLVKKIYCFYFCSVTLVKFIAINHSRLINMIKLFSLKQQKKEENASGAASAGKRKATAAQLRLTKG